MGIVALLLGKDIQMVSHPVKKREKALLTYESFYDAVAGTDAKKTILKLFSAKNSGIIFDFDGVLTNNYVYVDQLGNETVRCSRADGLAFDALRILEKKIYPCFLILYGTR